MSIYCDIFHTKRKFKANSREFMKIQQIYPLHEGLLSRLSLF